MGTFKAIFIDEEGGRHVIASNLKNREQAVTACVEFRGNYCLDKKEDRIKALSTRNFYILGCGPEEFAIEQED